MRTIRAAVTRDLLSALPEPGVKELAEGATLLKGFAAAETPALVEALARFSPQRRFATWSPRAATRCRLR